MSTEGECQFIHTLSLLKLWASGLLCGLSFLIGFKKKVMNLKLVQFFFVLTVEAKLLFVPGPKPEGGYIIYKLLFQDSKGAVTNYLK